MLHQLVTNPSHRTIDDCGSPKSSDNSISGRSKYANLFPCRQIVRREMLAAASLPLMLLCMIALSLGGSSRALARDVPAEDVGLSRPNVIVIITDDQGYGDIAAHGNEMIRTPNLDKLHGESVRLTNFHVDPTCSPTRSALMTGRYSTRTGVWHTIQGRSLMAPNEVTLAEAFAANGYRTGMFGKWHLGDNFPLRPQDQGFQTVLAHGGGGISQTPDWWGNDYFDDTLRHEDGTPEQMTGYCTDVFFRAATKFITTIGEKPQPFFCYLATNTPHGPYLVDNAYRQPYLDAGVPEPMASFYGMIANIDENVGKLTAELARNGLADNTILIFMTDNGTAAGFNSSPKRPQGWAGFNAGMKGTKGSPYDGGHRVPCFFRWPAGRLSGGRDVATLSAHIDLYPTLAELCLLELPQGPPRDGVSLVVPLMQENNDWKRPSPTLFVHSQRLEFVQKWRQSAVMTEQWRLVDGKQLYDMRTDPGQEHDVATEHADVVTQLRQEYEEWWKSLSPVFDQYVRIHLGNAAENPSRLTCHDWHTGDKPVPWNQNAVSHNPQQNGFWAVEIEQPGTYEFSLRMRPAGVIHDLPPGTAKVKVGDVEASIPIGPGEIKAVLSLQLEAGPAFLQTWLDSETGESRGAYFVDVRHTGK